MKKSVFTILLCCLIIFGCNGKNNSIISPDPIIDDLIKSPTSIQIDSTNFVLSVYLWRDFMPISPPDGKPMLASVEILTSDSSDFPENIDADKMWVIDSTNSWETFLYDQSVHESYSILKKASNGPKWEIGLYLDVVVRLVQDDTLYHYLKIEDVLLRRTD